MQPRHLNSWDAMDAFLRRHARRLFFRSTTSSGHSNKPILSRWRPPAERAYAHWLWDGNSTDEEGAVHRVMVQCRRRRQQPSDSDHQSQNDNAAVVPGI